MADWKKELQDAYRSSAKWAVKDSNKTFDKTISDTGRDALTRGLGRSSYTTQTLANLQTDKNEAGNRIKSEFELEFLKAKQQRELEEEQRELERQKLEEEKRQFDLQMEMNAAASAGGGGGGRGGRGGNNPSPDANPGDETPQDYDSWLGDTTPLRGVAVDIAARHRAELERQANSFRMSRLR